MTVGIIGYGIFGRFMAAHLAKHGSVVVWDKVRAEVDEGVQWGELDEVLGQEVLVLAVPVQHLEDLLREVGPRVRPDALVLDVASVKAVPVALMRKYLPKTCDIVATHPLFGPQSGRDGIVGLTLVVWNVRAKQERYEALKAFAGHDLGLVVREVAPEEHDQEMAYVQALTFFIGRVLDDMEIPDEDLKTATYQHLLDIRRIVANDTPELYESIQKFNPFAGEVRERFVRKLSEELITPGEEDAIVRPRR